MTPAEPGCEAAFARTCRLSHYAARVARAQPEIVADLARRTSEPFGRAAIRAEDRLPRNRFKRIHRSYIVSLDKIMAIEGNMVEVQEKERPKLLPIGKNYRHDLLELIEKNRLEICRF